MDRIATKCRFSKNFKDNENIITKNCSICLLFLLGHGGNADPGLFHKQSITEHAYYNTILPESTGKPYLIMFYSDWCFTCMRLEPIWSKLTEELEPVGFGIVTVHAGRQRELTRKIGSNELPHIALLLGSIHYIM